MLCLACRTIENCTGHEAGRLLLSELYRQHTGAQMPAILKAPQGKPYWENSSLHFSISHTKHHVFCAISDRPIGIDAEELNRDVNLKLADRILSPFELEQYQQAEDKRLALLKFWVLKEAQAKLTGEGIKFHPTHTNFSLDDPRVTVQENCLLAVMEEEYVI